jgi:hypothetical protein
MNRQAITCADSDNAQPKRPVNPIVSFASSHLQPSPPSRANHYAATPHIARNGRLLTTTAARFECALSSRAPTFLPRSTRAEDAKRFITSLLSPPPAPPAARLLPACTLRLTCYTPSDGLYVGSRRETATSGLDRKILTRQPAL